MDEKRSSTSPEAKKTMEIAKHIYDILDERKLSQNPPS